MSMVSVLKWKYLMKVKQVSVSLLPEKFRKGILHVKKFIEIKVIQLFLINGFFASFYYTFINTSFYREHKAVLRGRIAYHKSLLEVGKSCALLRRNTHRIEKGLIMRPRKPIFAEDYILETVRCYLRVSNGSVLCESEKQWATHVLGEYFDVVSDTKVIKQARAEFNSSGFTETIRHAIPYEQQVLPDQNISFEHLEQLFTRRRSVRWYQQRAVPSELIAKAIDLASLAPSACNRQPYAFYVVSERKRVTEIANYAGGTAGFSENIPCLVIVVGNLDVYPYERDRHLIYIDGSLASMQLMLALETLGLSTCPINWPDVESRERLLERSLNLEPYQRSIMLIAVGFADPTGGIPFSQKKSSEILMK